MTNKVAILYIAIGKYINFWPGFYNSFNERFLTNSHKEYFVFTDAQCVPFENEDLWSLAKRLSVCPEQLVSTNPELQFPLTGEERIVIYRQL